MGQNVVIKTRGSDDDVWGGHLGPSWTHVGPQDTLKVAVVRLKWNAFGAKW